MTLGLIVESCILDLNSLQCFVYIQFSILIVLPSILVMQSYRPLMLELLTTFSTDNRSNKHQALLQLQSLSSQTSLYLQTQHQSNNNLIKSIFLAIRKKSFSQGVLAYLLPVLPAVHVLIQHFYSPFGNPFKDGMMGYGYIGQAIIKQGRVTTDKPLLASGVASSIYCKIQGEQKLLMFNCKQAGARSYFNGKSLFLDYFTYSIDIPLESCKIIPFNLKRLEGQLVQALIQNLAIAIELVYAYTNMRTQFKSNQDGSERIISTYQVVKQRIAKAFSTLTGLSIACIKRTSIPKRVIAKLILEQLISLRECMGGFGYLSVSGLPTLINSTMTECIYGFQNEQLWLSKRQNQYYYKILISSKDKLKQLQSKDYDTSALALTSLMSYIHTPVDKFSDLSKIRFLKFIVIQALLQISRYNFQPLIQLMNAALGYLSADFILQNGKSPALRSYHLQSKDLFRTKVYSFISYLQAIGYSKVLKGVLIGRESSDEFYSKLLQLSEKSDRNSSSKKDYVRKPIVDILAKL